MLDDFEIHELVCWPDSKEKRCSICNYKIE